MRPNILSDSLNHKSNERWSHVHNIVVLAPDMKHVIICYNFFKIIVKNDVEECLGALHDLIFKFLLT